MTEFLSAYNVVRSTDIEEVREAVGKVVCPHRLDPYPHSNSGPSIFNDADLGDVALSYTEHGVPVRVRHEPLESTMLVRFSLTGSLTIRGGRGESRYDRHAAAVFDPSTAYDVSIESGARALVLRVEYRAIQAELHRIVGRAPTQRLRFAPSMSMDHSYARSWLSLLRMLRDDLDGSRSFYHPALRRPVQSLVISHLLTTVRHSRSAEVAGIGTVMPDGVRTRAIRRADQIISDHCREALTVSDIAEAVGVSVRSLQSGFRRYLNTTPIERLREARLSGVHAELLASDPSSVQVSQVALQWGFGHLGHFAEHYRTAFGETPSQTLRR